MLSCKRRGVPVPVAPLLRIEVIFPKLGFTLVIFPVAGSVVTDPKPPEGLANIGWLNRLNASARKVNPPRSKRAVRFERAVSIS